MWCVCESYLCRQQDLFCDLVYTNPTIHNHILKYKTKTINTMDTPNFIKIDAIISNAEQERLIGKKEWIDTFYYVNAEFIVSYMPYEYEDGGNIYIGTWVQLAGHGLISRLPIEKINNLINE